MKKPPHPISDLVEQWQQGVEPEESFRALFGRFHDPLFKLFRSKGFSEAECQDLIQETFLNVYRGLADYRPEKRFESWIFSIAINTANRYFRRLSTKKRGGDVHLVTQERLAGDRPWEPEGPPEGEGGPLRDLLTRERRLQLRRAIHELPLQMARCVKLRVDRDLRYSEIAEVLQISENTVKVQLFHARRRLREALGEYFDRVKI